METSDAARARTVLGATLGAGLSAFVWFIPVVAGEVIAIGLTMAARKDVDAPHGSKREWMIALIVSSPINLLLVAGALISVASFDTR